MLYPENSSCIFQWSCGKVVQFTCLYNILYIPKYKISVVCSEVLLAVLIVLNLTCFMYTTYAFQRFN